MLIALSSDFSNYWLLTISFACSMRLLRFPDLSLDAAYALGGAAFFLITKSFAVPVPYDLLLVTTLAIALGLTAGTTLTVLHLSTRTRLGRLLCGLVVASALYAIAFRMNGMATSQTLFDVAHSVTRVAALFTSPLQAEAAVSVACMLFTGGIWMLARQLFGSNIGLMIRIAGKRPELVQRTSNKPKHLLLLGLSFTSFVPIYAGVLRSATDNYTDLNTFGLFLVALAAYMLGVIFLDGLGSRFAERSEVFGVLTAATIGALLMTLLIHSAIFLFTAAMGNFVGSDIRLLVSVVIILGAVLSRQRSRVVADFHD